MPDDGNPGPRPEAVLVGSRAVSGLVLRPLNDTDRSWLTGFMTERWGTPLAAGGGRLHRLDELPGIVAMAGDRVDGVVTFLIESERCEIVSIDAAPEGEGIGTALLGAACDAARAAGCQRVELITTNDNLRALRFYQRRGFVLSALRPGAVDESRATLKPEIPTVGDHGIPLRDELVLTLSLS
jgi:ribosomal protein S18 acetylase RimI-like enzyme